MASAPDKATTELIIRGCLDRRNLTAFEISSGETLPSLTGGLFRLSAKGDIAKEIKEQHGRLVSVTGLVRNTALVEPGIKVGGARVVIGSGPMATDPTRDPMRNPRPRIYPMDVTAIARVADTCDVDKP
jgi:hypothetical protein